MSDLGNFNGYQSGGKGFVSPNQAIENATYREFMNKAGGVQGVAQKDQAEIADIIQSMVERLASEARTSNEEIGRMVEAVRNAVMSAPNQQQGAKAGMEQYNKFIRSDTDMISALGNRKDSTSAEKRVLQAATHTSLKRLVTINQEILKTLNMVAYRTNSGFGQLGNTMIEIDQGNDKRSNQDHQEEVEGFEGLRQALVHGLMNSPLTNKLSRLGASLISLGLMKVASNDKLPSWMRKTAATAIYLEVPQTLMNMVGMVISQVLGKWLMGSGGKLIGNAIGEVFKSVGKLVGNVFKMLGRAVVTLFTSATGLIIAGILAGVAGVYFHSKKMKENDKLIDSDTSLTKEEKDKKKVKAHAASGARAGVASGALLGAGIGTLIAPGIGTAIGAVIGAILGPIVGALTGAIGQWWRIGKEKKAEKEKNKQLEGIQSDLNSRSRSNSDRWAKLMSIVIPIGRVLFDFLALTSPFFTLFKAYIDKQNSNKDDGSGNTIHNPGKSNKVTRVAERLGLGKNAETSYTKDKAGNTYLGGHLITSDYGMRFHPVKKQWKMHTGIDLAYNNNDSVKAKLGGKVVGLKNDPHGYGNYVVIRDDKGAEHLYAHGNSFAKGLKVGDTVKAGQEIMKAGMTGTATGVHVHYEVRQNGKHTNPLEYLANDAEERAREEKERKEAEQKEKDEKFKKEHPNLSAMKELGKAIVAPKRDGSSDDISGNDDFAKRMSTTGNVLNVGDNR